LAQLAHDVLDALQQAGDGLIEIVTDRFHSVAALGARLGVGLLLFGQAVGLAEALLEGGEGVVHLPDFVHTSRRPDLDCALAAGHPAHDGGDRRNRTRDGSGDQIIGDDEAADHRRDRGHHRRHQHVLERSGVGGGGGVDRFQLVADRAHACHQVGGCLGEGLECLVGLVVVAEADFNQALGLRREILHRFVRRD
jgi:hypothetical protein